MELIGTMRFTSILMHFARTESEHSAEQRNSLPHCDTTTEQSNALLTTSRSLSYWPHKES